MVILGISVKHMKQNPKTPPHWRTMHTQPRGKKWAGKIKRALKSIRIQAIQDRATIQLRCEPIKRLYKLVSVTNTASLKERAQSMMWIYTATLRANMVRWQIQDHMIEKSIP